MCHKAPWSHNPNSRAAVGMGIPMGIPMGMGMGWVWGLKFNPHGSPAKQKCHHHFIITLFIFGIAEHV